VRVARGGGGQVDVGVAPGETWRHYADDGVKLVIKLDRFVDDVAATTELALPEKENGDGCAITVGRVGGEEFAAEKRRDAHELEQVGGINADIDGNGNLIAGEVLLRALREEDIFDGRGVANRGKPGAIREEQWTATVLVIELDVNHPVVILIRIGVEEYAVDNAEDRSGRADAKH
jgi:hypothetical protein